MVAYRGCNPPIQTIDPNDINFRRSGPREIPEPIVVVWKVGRPIAHEENMLLFPGSGSKTGQTLPISLKTYLKKFREAKRILQHETAFQDVNLGSHSLKKSFVMMREREVPWDVISDLTGTAARTLRKRYSATTISQQSAALKKGFGAQGVAAAAGRFKCCQRCGKEEEAARDV